MKSETSAMSSEKELDVVSLEKGTLMRTAPAGMSPQVIHSNAALYAQPAKLCQSFLSPGSFLMSLIS